MRLYGRIQRDALTAEAGAPEGSSWRSVGAAVCSGPGAAA